MCNYTVKLQLDTSIVFSALCASIKALQENPPQDIDGAIDSAEMSRLIMVKATNKLVGKRELSGRKRPVICWVERTATRQMSTKNIGSHRF
jgi:hypothetical protein